MKKISTEYFIYMQLIAVLVVSLCSTANVTKTIGETYRINVFHQDTCATELKIAPMDRMKKIAPVPRMSSNAATAKIIYLGIEITINVFLRIW